jgi:hypothetical protein
MWLMPVDGRHRAMLSPARGMAQMHAGSAYAALEGNLEIKKSWERPHLGHVKILSPVGFPKGGISTVSSVSLPQA